MKIRMLTSISGTTGSYAEGDIVDWPDDKDAKRLIAAGFAEKPPAAKGKKTETAAAKAVVETATTD